jgi:hypothetical protein
MIRRQLRWYVSAASASDRRSATLAGSTAVAAPSVARVTTTIAGNSRLARRTQKFVSEMRPDARFSPMSRAHTSQPDSTKNTSTPT